MLGQVLETISSHWVSVISALVSLSSALFAIIHRQNELKISWNREVIAWAHSSMRALANAKSEIETLGVTPTDASLLRITDHMAALSASADQGRVFFTNIDGLRPNVLDPLVSAYRLLGDLSRLERSDIINAIDIHRTNFWKRVQGVVDSDWMRKTMMARNDQAGRGAFDYAHPSRDP